MSVIGGLLAGWSAIATGLFGREAYKRRKKAKERLNGLEDDLMDIHQNVFLDTGRQWFDGERMALSSKTLDLTAEVDVDFSGYETVDDVLEEESLEGLGSSFMESMTDEYTPGDSSIDRYNIAFEGENGGLRYSVTSEEFMEGYNDEDELQLKSVDEVYSETFGDEDYTSLL